MSGAITAGVVGAAGSIAGGMMASKGAKQAGAAQQAGIDQATQLQAQMYQQNRQDLQPWMQAGRTGLNALLYGLGLGGGLPNQPSYGASTMPDTFNPELIMGPRPTEPDAARQWDINAGLGQAQFNKNKEAERAQQEANLAAMTPEQRNALSAGGLQAGGLMKQFGPGDLQLDPGYKFRLRQGLKALDRTASARGGLLSGGALKAATGYGQEMGSQEYGNAFNRFQIGQTNQYNRLAALSGVGQQTAQQLGQSAQNYGQLAGNLAVQGGANQANALLGAAQARGSIYQGIGSSLGGGMQQYRGQQNFNQLMGVLNRGGGGGGGYDPYGIY